MTKDIEAREKAATPLTDKEYAEWKGNIEGIAEAHAGGWYTRRGKEFVPAAPPGDEIATTIGIQLRLFATIDDLLAQLRDREEKLEAVEEWANRKPYLPVSELGRILKGGE